MFSTDTDCHRQTDRQMDGRTGDSIQRALSIYAICCRALKTGTVMNKTTKMWTN